MDLRDYREMPNEGLFEKIERRVRLRRLVRVGGVAAAAAVVTVAAVWLLTPRSEVGIQKSEVMASANVLEVAGVEPTMTGNTQEHQTTPETTLVSKESQVAENIQPAVRRSEILNPQVPEPISISAQPIASAEQPSLPPAVVRTETAGMDEVFSEQSSVTSDHNVDVEGGEKR